MQPEAVVFDIGNVLTGWQPEAFYDRVHRPRGRRALVRRGAILHAMNALVDDGALFRETIYDAGRPPPAIGRAKSACGTTAGSSWPAP